MNRKRIAGGVHVREEATPRGSNWEDKDWYLCMSCGDLTRRDRAPSRCSLCDSDSDITPVELDDDADPVDLSTELKELAMQEGDLYGVAESEASSEE